MTKIKFCGLSRICDIEAANEILPDYIGFVFAKKSRRYVSPETAERLRAQLRPEIRTVGVFVNESPVYIADLRNRGVMDIVQLHGNETDADIAALRQLCGATVIRAFRVRDMSDAARALESSADAVLLDAAVPGAGQVFDWQLIRGFARPYFLAGGLCPENAAEAVSRLHPDVLDVSSGIETDGYKDPEKMRRFAAAVRNI